MTSNKDKKSGIKNDQCEKLIFETFALLEINIQSTPMNGRALIVEIC